MSITDQEPDLPIAPPRAIASIRGAFKLLVHDPVGEPSKGSHDEWHAKFIAESAKLIPGWDGGVALKETPEVTPDTTELLTLVARTDGKAWPSLTGKRADFSQKLQRLAQWIMEGRLILYGNVPSPSKLIRSQAIEWDVATKEQWATWFDSAWPTLPVFGSVLERPKLLIGDEAAWAWAMPGDLVITARGISPMGIRDRLRSVMASRDGGFESVDLCVGLSWAENQKYQQGEYWTNAWNELCQAFYEISAILTSEGYIAHPQGGNIGVGYRFLEPPSCAPGGEAGSRLGEFPHRNYARQLAIGAAQAYFPIVTLAEGSWQEPELPGMLSPRHVAKTGAGVEVKSRLWTPTRSKKK